MKHNQGFTLIELIVVIVILGVLAVTAAPKFIDLQTDARIATLNGIKASINSALNMVKAKAVIKGADKSACALVCLKGGGSDCPQGDVASCTSGQPNVPDNYVLITNGGLNSNSALKSLQNILDLDTDNMSYETCGPAGNICIMFKDRITSCCSYISSNVDANENACMVHLWLYTNYNTVQVVKGGC